jgi:hypothetical protein
MALWERSHQALSALRLLALVNGGTNVTVPWESVAGVNYFLERNTNFPATETGIPGQPGTTIFTDANTFGAGPGFYRVGLGD